MISIPKLVIIWRIRFIICTPADGLTKPIRFLPFHVFLFASLSSLLRKLLLEVSLGDVLELIQVNFFLN